MKAHLLFSLIITIGSVQIALSDDLLKSIQSLNTFDTPEARTDPSAYMAATDQVIRAWNTATNDDKSRFATKVFLIHFRRAELLAASGDFLAAATELTEEASLQKAFGGRIEFATKSPDAFFRDLIELQAQVTAETGSDPLADKVGYSFQKEGDGFTAARLELGDDVAGITVPEIESEEALALVHRISRQGGRFVASAPKWFVVPKGRLPDVLEQAKREVGFDSTGKMTVQTLQAGSGTKSTTTNLDSATASSQLPPVVQPPTPANAHDVKPPIVSEEPTSSTPWSIIVVLIVVAIGLLCLLFNSTSRPK